MMITSLLNNLTSIFLLSLFISYPMYLRAEASVRESVANLPNRLTVESRWRKAARQPSSTGTHGQMHKIITLRGAAEVDLIRRLCEGPHDDYGSSNLCTAHAQGPEVRPVGPDTTHDARSSITCRTCSEARHSGADAVVHRSCGDSGGGGEGGVTDPDNSVTYTGDTITVSGDVSLAVITESGSRGSQSQPPQRGAASDERLQYQQQQQQHHCHHGQEPGDCSDFGNCNSSSTTRRQLRRPSPPGVAAARQRALLLPRDGVSRIGLDGEGHDGLRGMTAVQAAAAVQEAAAAGVGIEAEAEAEAVAIETEAVAAAMQPPSLRPGHPLNPSAQGCCDNGSSRKSSISSNSSSCTCLYALRGKCRHYYGALLYGVSGSFSNLDVACLRRCLGPGVLAVESDGLVVKAEGSAPPATLLRSMVQSADPRVTPAGGKPSPKGRGSSSSRPGSSGSGGGGNSGAAGDNGNGDGGAADLRYRVDGSPLSVPLERLTWLQNSVGRAAEERLAAAATAVDAAAAAAVDAAMGAVNTAALAAHAVLADAAAARGGGGSDGWLSSGVLQEMIQSAPAPPTRTGTASGVIRGRPDAASVDVQEHANASGPLLMSRGIKLDSVDRALWNLDRIDQRHLPLDGIYRFGSSALRGTGQGVTIYSVDSGVYADHNEFRPWPDAAAAAATTEVSEQGSSRPGSRAIYGYNFVDGDKVAADCDGHGTHVASSAVGRSVGVARGSRLLAVRVLDCNGSGTIADTVAGLDWVARNAQLPAVAMMSLGVPAGSWSDVLSESVRTLVQKHGIVVVVASGNSAVDSCTVVPANVPEVLTVAASNLENKFGPGARGGRESMYQWANTGACVDLFAPGVEIFGACGGGDRCSAITPGAYTWASGTSMAAPLVAGVAALYLEAHPQARPAEVAAALLAGASEDAVRDERMLPGTPNRLLYSRLDDLVAGAPPAAAAEGPQETSVTQHPEPQPVVPPPPGPLLPSSQRMPPPRLQSQLQLQPQQKPRKLDPQQQRLRAGNTLSAATATATAIAGSSTSSIPRH